MVHPHPVDQSYITGIAVSWIAVSGIAVSLCPPPGIPRFQPNRSADITDNVGQKAVSRITLLTFA